MKRSLRTLLVLAALLLAALLLAACGAADPEDTTAPATSVPATSAPATTAPVTSAPATSAPATSAPATSAPVTTAPSAPLSFSTLQAQGEDAYGITLPNATTEFSFRDEVTVAAGVSYTVSRDRYGEQAIISKTATLAEGENIVYLHVENGDDYFVLTVTLYRRPMHTVTFDLMDGAAPVTQAVEEGSLATPPAVPYPEEFLGWDKDVTAPITEPTCFVALRSAYPVTYDYALPERYLPYLTSAENPARYTVGVSTPLAAPENTYMTFLGWTLNGETVSAIPAGTTGTVTLIAEWRTSIHPDCVGLELVTEDTPFTGDTVATSWGLSKRISFAEIAYTFRQIDPVSGDLIEDLGKTKPVKSGTYEVTASFTFKRNAKDEDKQYTLPEPMTKRFVVTAGTLDPAKINFGAKDTEIYMRPSLSFNPAESTVVVGTPSVGLERNFSIVKLAGKDDTSAGTAVTTPGLITEADGAGYYRVTIGYTEKDNGENWTNEQSVTHEAIVYVRTIEKQVKRAEGIVIDGIIDDEYRMSAFYTTKFQAMGDRNAAGGYYELAGEIVDPYKFAALAQIFRGVEVTEPNNTADATFYVLWGEEAGVPYIYVAIEVEDETNYARSHEYTSQPNPWTNDSVELYYTFGPAATPDLSNAGDIYPTYNSVMRDSRTGGNTVGGAVAHSTVVAQRSIYFDEIRSAVQGRDTEGDNTYVIEYKFPAKSESFNGTIGYPDFERYEGEALGTGDFIYLACQINDLTGIPEGYDSIEDYPSYMACCGNRSKNYLNNPAGGPMVFQLSDEWATE